MKKIFTLIAVAMMAITAMAQKTVTISLDDNALANLGAGSYITEVKDVEATWTFDGTDFLVSNICRNAKNQPVGYWSDQVVQVKSGTGYIINKEAMNLASLVLTTPTATDKITILAGTSADELTAVTPTISTVDLEVKTYVNKAEGTAVKTLNVLTYDLTGMKYVKLTASASLHIWSAVIGLAEETTDEPSADEDTFNITVTDGKLTVAPTNAERGYYFAIMSPETWAGMQAEEGYTSYKEFIEDDLKGNSYDDLVDWQYILVGEMISGWPAAYLVGEPGEYIIIAAYVDKDLTVSNPVEIKLTVDEEGNFVLDTPTAIKNANVAKQLRKFIENGKIVMMKDGKKFNAAGMLVK